jgi:hypothetical protein
MSLTIQHLKKIEMWILGKLDFRMCSPSPYFFINADLIKTKNKLDDIIQSLGLKENMLNTIKVEFDNTIELLNKKEID